MIPSNSRSITNHSSIASTSSLAQHSAGQIAPYEENDEITQLGIKLSNELLKPDGLHSFYARWLLHKVGPDKRVIEIDGVAIPRSYIEEIEKGFLPVPSSLTPRHLYEEELALQNHIKQGWGANVHLNGLLSVGALTLRKLKALNQGTLDTDLDSLKRSIIFHLPVNLSRDERKQAIRGLEHALSQKNSINENGLNTHTAEVLCQVWTYCSRHSDENLRGKLIESFTAQLRDIGATKDLCTTGSIQRLLQTMQGIDPQFNLPGKDLIEPEITALLVHPKDLDMGLNHYFDKKIAAENMRFEDTISFKQIQMKASIEKIMVEWRGFPQSFVAEAMCRALDGVEANDLYMENRSYGNLDASYRNYRGETALMRAVVKNDPKSVQALLNKLVNGKLAHFDQSPTAASYLNQTDNKGWTSLHIAAQNGLDDMVGKLLEVDGIDVHLTDFFGNTALHLAAANGNADVVDKLLESGINVNQANNEYRTPLHLAAANGHTAVVERLLAAKGIKVNKKDNWRITALHIAAENGHAAVVDKLLAAKGIKVDQADNRGMTALHIAAQKNYAAVVEKLLAAEGIKVNQADDRGMTVLHIAVKNGHPDMVEKLLADARTEVNQTDDLDMTALHYAVESGHTAVVEKLLADTRTEVNQTDDLGESALYIAALMGLTAVVEKLLADTRTEVNQTNKQGMTTALHIAAANGHTAVVEKLLADARTKVNQTNKQGMTALHIAALMGLTAVVEKLLADTRTKVNQTNKQGMTAFYIAALKGNYMVIEKLIPDPRTDVKQWTEIGRNRLSQLKKAARKWLVN